MGRREREMHRYELANQTETKTKQGVGKKNGEWGRKSERMFFSRERVLFGGKERPELEFGFFDRRSSSRQKRQAKRDPMFL
ncbi:hypothetical protein COLO4_06606 [Corchorus olitorius]|uniref:Uncharacterized protein n=1 Tax=Corchorus olitorius TaxID=93759 RepID=A0A1R3KMS2_9ROSI|nr:hypothetical protein COLO4_06606 [Corchorus olitorius]